MSQQLTREEQERKYPEYTWDLKVMKHLKKLLKVLKLK